MPQPVPGRLFRSITVYDAQTRSQSHAALRSLFELKDADPGSPVTLYFGPDPPAAAGAAARWIKTILGRGWFAYFRIYGPTERAFDGNWRLPDFEPGGLPSCRGRASWDVDAVVPLPDPRSLSWLDRPGRGSRSGPPSGEGWDLRQDVGPCTANTWSGKCGSTDRWLALE